MKLMIDFSTLWASAKAMGEHEASFDLQYESAPLLALDRGLSSSAGLEISLDELELENGVLSYQGRQVLLFIPDQSSKVTEVIAGTTLGTRFHVADCRTLGEMRDRNRFNRYKATYNTSGQFQVYGTHYESRASIEGEAQLKVCKNCLSYLNYRGYKSRDGASSASVFNHFSIAEFLSEYSTLFSAMPERAAFIDQGGYAPDWAEVSRRYRSSVNYCCESCQVDLTAHRRLLHTHHVSGNKRENHESNLQALCIDCHRKQPFHEYMRVAHHDMQLLTQLRKQQGLFNTGNWQQVREMADQAVDGLLRHFEKNGMERPEVGYLLLGADGNAVAELELAWPLRKIGVAIANNDLQAATRLGWDIRTVGQALKGMNQ